MTPIRLILCTILLIAGSALHATESAGDHEQTLQSLLARAGSAQARGDFAGAAEAYRKAVEIEPSIPELWANLGLMYHQTGKHAEAIRSFKRAMQLKPSLFVPQLFLGIEYLAAEDPKSAIPFLKNAAKLNPQDLQAALSLGRAYSMLDQGSKAAEAYWAATELAPNEGSAWLALGTLYLQQVENDARVMNSKYRESPYAKLRAAEIFAEQGKLIEAESAFKSVLASSVPPSCTHAELGITLLHQKKWIEAQQQFQLETQSASSCGLAQLGTGVALMAQGQTDSGLNELSVIAGSDPSFVQANLPLFRGVLSSIQIKSLADVIHARQSSGNLSADIGEIINGALNADAVLTNDLARESPAMRALQPGSTGDAGRLQSSGKYSACNEKLKGGLDKLAIEQQRLLASCSFYSGDFRTTATAAQYLKLNTATLAQGLYWESKADQRLAVAALARAGEIDPDSPQMHILLGDIFRQKRHWSEAEAEYRKALALDPKSRSARLNLAIDLFTELKSEEALDLDKSLLAEVPQDPEANLLAGEILVQQHQYEQAEPYVARCGKLGEDLQPRLHILLGQIYSQTGRIAEAISEYKMGLANDPDGSLHYQLARLYQKSGNAAAASEQIRISRQLRERWDNQAHVAMEQRSTDLSKQ